MSGVDYAPHRRARRGRIAIGLRRAWERFVVNVFRLASAAIARIPLRVSEPVAVALFAMGRVLWPAKRRIVSANLSHVLGRPQGDPEVRRLTRRVYATYARFALEIMRLPSLPPDEPLRLLPPGGEAHDRFLVAWERCQAEGRGMIAVSGHIGSIEVFAGSYAQQGIPTYGLADDSAFPELFDLLNRSRARWGVTIIPWRNLRALFKVLRAPAVVGMVVDWGYRRQDVPVRLFGSWTTLPEGPAALAARTGAVILPVAAHRGPDGLFAPLVREPIEVPDASPRAILGATQAIADALEGMIGAAPDQWYTFKPMWPSTPEEREALARRAAATEAG
jgi:lauroyl/myristoyl acyltransferase